MVRPASLATLALLALAPPAVAGAAGAETPPEPGAYWETQVERLMPAQTSTVCLPKKGAEDQPPGSRDEQCKIANVKRAGQRMTWNVSCRDGTSGEGDITWGMDTYEGTMKMHTHGQVMRMKVKGKKVGGDCDANETRRTVAAVTKQGGGSQAQSARAQAMRCSEAADEMAVTAFAPTLPGLPVECKDATRFCANLETRKGLVALRVSPELPDREGKAARLCNKDLPAIEKHLCDATAKEQEKVTTFSEQDALEYVFAYCPDLAKMLVKRECAGRKVTALPPAQGDFCARWAPESLAGGK
jgi:hypothetical protein